MYTEKNQLVELHTGAINQFLFFINGQAAPVLDGATGALAAVVKPLAQTATITGYPCQSLQIANEAEGTSTVC